MVTLTSATQGSGLGDTEGQFGVWGRLMDSFVPLSRNTVVHSKNQN